MNDSFWHKAQNIDPRILYVICIFVIAVPLLNKKIALPITPNAQTVRAFNVVQSIGEQRPAKLAIVDGEWSASTRGENMFQEEALLEHLMRLHIPFALMTFVPQNRVLSQRIADTLAPKYGYVYGRDYVNWGYKAAGPLVLKGMSEDMVGALKEDANHMPLKGMPIMQGVHNYKDISLIIEITPTSSLESWIGLVEGINHTPIIYAPTAVMAPEGYPLLDSHQIQGIITGVAGAGDYETLLKTKGDATQVATSLSFVYGLIILLIVIGNIGYYAARAEDRKALAR